MESVSDAGGCGIGAGKAVIKVGLGGLEGVGGAGHGCCGGVGVGACHYAEDGVVVEAEKIGKCAVEHRLMYADLTVCPHSH